jgi:uncharacterized membrane protein HdeD (DUF308 family)
MAESKSMGVGLSVLTGLLAIVLGIALLANPGASLKTVIYLFGIMVIVYGLARIFAGLRGHMESKSAGVVGGLFAIILGVMIMAWPKMSALTLIYLIGGWAIVTGVVDIGGVFVSKAGGAHRVWMAVVGLVSVVFGLILFFNPGEGGLALLWLIGVYLIVMGFIRIIVGIFAPMGKALEQTQSQGPHPF